MIVLAPEFKSHSWGWQAGALGEPRACPYLEVISEKIPPVQRL